MDVSEREPLGEDSSASFGEVLVRVYSPLNAPLTAPWTLESSAMVQVPRTASASSVSSPTNFPWNVERGVSERKRRSLSPLPSKVASSAAIWPIGSRMDSTVLPS